MNQKTLHQIIELSFSAFQLCEKLDNKNPIDFTEKLLSEKFVIDVENPIKKPKTENNVNMSYAPFSKYSNLIKEGYLSTALLNRMLSVMGIMTLVSNGGTQNKRLFVEEYDGVYGKNSRFKNSVKVVYYFERLPDMAIEILEYIEKHPDEDFGCLNTSKIHEAEKALNWMAFDLRI